MNLEKSTSDCPELENLLWPAPNKECSVTFKTLFLNQVVNDARFQDLCLRMPVSEVVLLRQVVERAEKDNSLTRFLVLNRILHPVCNTCRFEGDVSKLQCCTSCQMTFYCSKTCQTTDWSKHKEWCCKLFAKPEEGPLETKQFINPTTKSKFSAASRALDKMLVKR